MPDADENAMLELLKQKLASFLSRNPLSRVEIGPDEDKEGESTGIVLSPWGDDSVSISCRTEDESFIEKLNDLFLPERYSALLHISSKRFEVAWTAFPISEKYQELQSRAFDFTHGNKTYKCKYGRSSDSLLEIAARFAPREATNSTDYRNLFAFSAYASYKKQISQGNEEDTEFPDFFKDAKPISFWIEDVEWDEDTIFDLVNHVNFYMTYYDTISPTINVHSPRAENITRQPQRRMAYGDFPAAIISRPLDDNLLHFWQASRAGDPARRFLYNYQIVEYASFSVIEDAIAKSLKKLLSAPHVISRPESVVTQILEFTSEIKMSDPQKVEHLFRRTVDSRIIWDEISLNIEAFIDKTVFDGGHVIPALVKKTWTADDFATAWPIQFAGTIRGIRNALSHGREQRMTAVSP